MSLKDFLQYYCSNKIPSVPTFAELSYILLVRDLLKQGFVVVASHFFCRPHAVLVKDDVQVVIDLTEIASILSQLNDNSVKNSLWLELSKYL